MLLRDQHHRLDRSALTWADRQLSQPVLLHAEDCRLLAAIERGDAGRCTCRTALDRLSEGTVVVVLESDRGRGSLVRADGCAPCWVETAALSRCRSPQSRVSGVVPEDFREWVERSAGEGRPGPSRRTPRGGELVFVRGEEDREPWRYVGHVREGGEVAVLLVRGSIPLDRVLDADRPSTRVVRGEPGRAIRAISR